MTVEMQLHYMTIYIFVKRGVTRENAGLSGQQFIPLSCSCCP